MGRPITSAIVYSDLSDHLPVLLRTNIGITKDKVLTNVVSRREYDSGSLKDFNTTLFHEDWSSVLLCLNNNVLVEDGYRLFLEKYTFLFEKYFPLKLCKMNNRNTPRKVWITKGLVKSCKKKSKLFKTSKKTPTPENKAKYRNYRNKLKTVLLAAEKSYYAAQFASYNGNLASIWKLIRRITGSTVCDKTTKTFDYLGTQIEDKKEVANRFNNFFTNVGRDLANKIPPSPVTPESYLAGSFSDSMVLFPTTDIEIVNIVNEFNSKTSFGCDNIPLAILKGSIAPIAGIVSKLVNCSFEFGFFPMELKIAKVCPIYKAGKKNVFTNYRPISLLTSFSKVYEKAMQTRLMKYLCDKNILSQSQFGFRSGHSAFMALLNMCNQFTKSLDDGRISLAVFIDLQKAFDSLCHKTLLSKLHHYGIRGLAHSWFESYLSQRTQFVAYNNTVSDMSNVSWGVPQGSIIGPVLFIVYINDIVNCSSLMRFLLFADDTNLCLTSDNYPDIMRIANCELEKLNIWFIANKLSLNVSKTNYMIITNKKSKPGATFKIMIANQSIERVMVSKFLGILVDDKLTWKDHITQIATKISKSIGIMNRIKNILDNSTLKMLYTSLILPYLTYCNIVWGGARVTSLNKLFILQKRAVRIVCRAPYLAHTSPLFVATGFLKLCELHKKELAIFMFRYHNNLLPACCSGLITSVQTTHNYSLRKCASQYKIETSHTVIRQAFLSNSGPIIWNSLSDSLKNSVSLAVFKKDIRKSLLECYLT